MRSNRAFLASIAVSVCTTALAACDANFHSIFRETPGNWSKVAYTDAKQGATIIKVDPHGMMQVCAARSPDVFSALATAFSGSADLTKAAKSLGLSATGSSAEGAASFGLRTQLTQTQIELLYQLCLNALNGNLTKEELATEIHRYQNTMVTMLAIEQLTGYARPTVVALASKSGAGGAESLVKLQESLAAARTKEADLKAKFDAAAADLAKKKDAADKASAAVNKGEEDKIAEAELTKLKAAEEKAKTESKEASDAKDLAEKTYKDQVAVRQSLEKLLAQAQKQVELTAEAGDATIESPVASGDPNAAEKVAEAVVRLQENHMRQVFLMDECVQYLFRKNGADPKLTNICTDYINHYKNYTIQTLYMTVGCNKDGSKCSNDGRKINLPPAYFSSPPRSSQPFFQVVPR